MAKGPVRVAVALSGGVDSSVAALFLRRCLHTHRDLDALRWWTHAGNAPCFGTLLHAIQAGTPWSAVVPPPAGMQPRGDTRSVAAGGADDDDATPMELLPFFMHNWHDDDSAHGWCTAAERDFLDAQAVARALGLVAADRSLTVVDLSAAYAERCFAPMLAAYSRGHTHNVDVLCNSEVKFGALVEEHLGWRGRGHTPPGPGRVFSPFTRHPCDYLATGHYARTVRVGSEAAGVCEGGESSQSSALLARPLTAGNDLNDQTLFLAQVSPALWDRAVFPLGHLFRTKADVRRLCEAYGASAAATRAAGDTVWERISRKKTSTGVCFVGAAAQQRGGGRPRKGKATAQQLPSCSLSFASFLHEYIPSSASSCSTPKGSAAALSTRFVVLPEAADSSTRPPPSPREVPAEWFRWEDARLPLAQGATTASPGPLPAYAFTIGQRLRCFPPDHRGRPHHLYVLEKVLHHCDGSSGDGAGWLREVRLVARWDHPQFFTRGPFCLDGVVWHVPPAVLRRCQRSDEVCCVGCTRHLEPLRRCCLTLPPPLPEKARGSSSGADREEGGGGGPPHVVTVRVESGAPPFRALSAGQLFVAYVPLSSLALSTRDGGGGGGTGAVAGDDPLVVVASGWVTGEAVPGR